MVPIIRPKIIDYFYDLEGNIIGKIAGVFLKEPIDVNGLMKEFILALEKLKGENIQALLIEDLHKFSNKELDTIERESNLKIIRGMDILLAFLPLALDSIYKQLGVDLKSQEVLIIGQEEELTKKTIEAICKSVSFITITGEYEKESVERIYEYILEKTGLSIFHSKNIDKILTNYSIIINLIDNCMINTNKIRKDAIIFDFSISKFFSKNIIKNTKLTPIEEFVFKGEHIRKSSHIPKLLPAHIYEYLAERNTADFCGFYGKGELLTVEEFVNLKIKNKGTL